MKMTSLVFSALADEQKKTTHTQKLVHVSFQNKKGTAILLMEHSKSKRQQATSAAI